MVGQQPINYSTNVPLDQSANPFPNSQFFSSIRYPASWILRSSRRMTVGVSRMIRLWAHPNLRGFVFSLCLRFGALVSEVASSLLWNLAGKLRHFVVQGCGDFFPKTLFSRSDQFMRTDRLSDEDVYFSRPWKDRADGHGFFRTQDEQRDHGDIKVFEQDRDARSKVLELPRWRSLPFGEPD